MIGSSNSVHRYVLVVAAVAVAVAVLSTLQNNESISGVVVDAWITPYSISTTTRNCRQMTSTVLNAEEKKAMKAKTKSITSEMIEYIEDPIDPKELVGDADQKRSVPPEQDDLAPMVRCIVNAADQRKADNIVALRVSPISTVTSFVVFVTGNSRPQNQAIAAAVQKDVQQQFDQLPGSTGVPEGTADSGWMVLDYGSVMVHVMTPKSRLFYNVEGNWRDKGADEMDITDIIMPNTIVGPGASAGASAGPGTSQQSSVDDDDDDDSSSQSRGPGRMENLDEEEDPFWS
mmetsp:Transcript_10743/g.25599  ORF Transcript_10743/g.25599 Transcript_10743/m.25599 type:complete len:288 (+) Transcript_10743:164-1027(+)|eukprot:CAMPEP_0113498692 /NCGR_PEP_ID=MMETSP0014_2-20120614/31320_1 /TAXON_ID=2857 /ORGANISM="Nitzschia sp." /LENGTH=287 /DNA_ID=CAMNT_0000392757 /DNA_START=55 /DNA_END=918 /DNA_ORIENTATION=+ /assembly_acc=CAM_ASM_000159